MPEGTTIDWSFVLSPTKPVSIQPSIAKLWRCHFSCAKRLEYLVPRMTSGAPIITIGGCFVEFVFATDLFIVLPNIPMCLPDRYSRILQFGLKSTPSTRQHTKEETEMKLLILTAVFLIYLSWDSQMPMKTTRLQRDRKYLKLCRPRSHLRGNRPAKRLAACRNAPLGSAPSTSTHGSSGVATQTCPVPLGSWRQ
jgi:hypothetical protein